MFSVPRMILICVGMVIFMLGLMCTLIGHNEIMTFFGKLPGYEVLHYYPMPVAAAGASFILLALLFPNGRKKGSEWKTYRR